MSKAAMHSLELGRARSSTPKIDKHIIVPLLAWAYALIISPLLIGRPQLASALQTLMEPHPENRYFWTALAAITLVLAVRNWSRLVLPPHIKWLFAYLAFAGVSISWAFKPDISFIRFVSQVMIITSIVLPAMLAARTTDMMHGLFLGYAFASVLNVFFVLNQTPIMVDNESIGYPGYFSFKGTMGECAAIAFLLSLREMLYPGFRRALAIIVVAIDIWLMLVSKSKGALGLACITPFLAVLTLIAAKRMRNSPAIVLLSILFCYVALSIVTGFNMNKLSYHLYNNYTFSGRTWIWDFANYEIGRRPLAGWGYQSFWLVGPDAPSVVDAPGWVKNMPSAHNGYLDIKLETGYIGYALFVSFLIATLHAIGRVADRDGVRAWLLLTLALFVILTNFLETTWTRGAEPLWVVFVMVAAEIGRYCAPFRPCGDASNVRIPRPRRPFVSGRLASIAPRRQDPG